MKYIIEIEEKPLCVFDKDTQTYFPRLWRVKGFNSLVFDEDGLSRLEELNSDYINEHFGDLQDTAYQRGLDDAWEAAREIADMWNRIDNDELLAIFGITERIGHSTIRSLFEKQTANEAMLELEAYEEKQKADGEIKVGDEVRLCRHKVPYIVTSCDGDDDTYILMTMNGGFIKAEKYNVRKTGRHFDIEKLLEAMKA